VGEVVSYDQLNLLEQVQLTKTVDELDFDVFPFYVGYSLIVDIRSNGWICAIDYGMLNPNYYVPAPLAHHLDVIEGMNGGDRKPENKLAAAETPINPLDEDYIDVDVLVLPTKTEDSFGGQHQDEPPPLKFGGQGQDKEVVSVFGEYWIELIYKTIKGVTYGPYRYQRWRDAQGRKRSRYLGKALKSAHDGATDSTERDRNV
jgi:hypothetical protein